MAITYTRSQINKTSVDEVHVLQCVSLSNLGRVEDRLEARGPFRLSRPRWGMDIRGGPHYIFLAAATQVLAGRKAWAGGRGEGKAGLSRL
jgi:hypothetical protein